MLRIYHFHFQHFRDFENLDIIVSPYESDAQLAFLVNEGLADVVVTEDSDLIVFGCEKVITSVVLERVANLKTYAF